MSEREPHDEQQESLELKSHEFLTGIFVDRSNPTSCEIADEIETKGKIPFSRFMEISLYGKHGYYSSGKVEIGTADEADFITSPEASKHFCAGLAKELSKVWQAMGRPAKFDVVEMGAGTGEMASQILDWSKSFYPDFHKCINYNILEYGSGLIPRQQSKLTDQRVNWVNGNAYQLPFSGVKGVFISNELPDAFPVECVGKLNGELRQRYISIKDGQWVERWEDVQEDVQEYIDRYNIQIDELSEIAVNLHAVELQKQLDAALEEGAIISIDYGFINKRSQPTISAVRQGGKNYSIGSKIISTLAALENPALASVLKSGSSTSVLKSESFKGKLSSNPMIIYQPPGDYDITSDVDFSALRQTASYDGLQTVFLGSQGDFFANKVGIGEIIRILNTKPWSQLLTKDQYSSSPLSLKNLNRFGNYICLMVAKSQDGRVEEQLSRPEPPIDLEDLEYGYPFRVWEAAASSSITIVRFYDGLFPHPPKLSSDGARNIEILKNATESFFLRDNIDEPHLKDGILYLFPDELEGTVIYNDKGEPVWDLRDKEQLKKFVEGSGYEWDV